MIIFRANEPFCRALITKKAPLLLNLLLLFQSSNLTIHDEDIEKKKRERRVFASFGSPFISKRSSSLAAAGSDFVTSLLGKKRSSAAALPNPMFINDAAAARGEEHMI